MIFQFWYFEAGYSVKVIGLPRFEIYLFDTIPALGWVGAVSAFVICVLHFLF